MSFQEAISNVFSNYANFSGRARRSEYWYFVLFNLIVSTVLAVIAKLTGGSILGTLVTVVQAIYSLGVIIPGLAVSWRRLHDTGRSGLWYFIGFVPIVGIILLIVWCCKDSDPGENEYGPCPKDFYDSAGY